MLTMQQFAGLNNVKAAEELTLADLTQASNVDLDLEGRAARRAGYSSTSATEHRNVWEAPAFTLATRGAAGDLVNVTSGAVLHAALGHAPRLWYALLPDGRVAYANGVTQGLVAASGASVTSWGVPVPATLGAAANAAGQLHAGKYRWALTHVRLADLNEGGPAYSNATVDVTTGGISLTGIPVPAGYRTNVYLTSHDGAEHFYAGFTTNGTFPFTGKNSALQQPCRTEFMQPPPVGKLPGFWRGRTLLAAGSVLYASNPYSGELFDLRKDFKQFSAPITMVQPVDGGIWVGTTKELAFLAGSQWDQLVRQVKVAGPVLLGSGVRVPGEHLGVGDGRGEGDCMVCIADGWLVGGTGGGSLVPLSQDRYRTSFTEVAATFRLVGTAPKQTPQYIAIQQ